jgi:hypothetical protein
MRTILSPLALVLLLSGCSKEAPGAKSAQDPPVPVTPLKITQFYSDPAVIRGAGKANLCYGVEGAAKVSVDPPVDRVWPAMSHCFEVTPKATTTYTLTAEDSNGTKVSQKTMVQVGPAGVKIVEVSVNALTIKSGESFPFCVRAINAKSWTLSAGKWRNPPDSRGGCAVDNPKQTTTYIITATGAMGETDTERVTATVQ